jgi:PAN domain
VPAANVCSNLTVHATLMMAGRSISTVTPSGGPEACCAACANTTGCNFWSLANSGPGYCYLYSTAFGIQPQNVYYSNAAGRVAAGACAHDAAGQSPYVLPSTCPRRECGKMRTARCPMEISSCI